MKYQLDIEIDKPMAEVLELFDSFENMKHWQPDLVSYEHLSGEPGQVGAKTRLLYKMGKRECELIETVTEKDLPRSFAGTYEAKGMVNSMQNRFEETSADSTRWISDVEFEFTSIPMKIMGFFMKKNFPKQSYQYMEQFKAFAERQ